MPDAPNLVVDGATFPTFVQLPEAPGPDDAAGKQWYLLGHIKDDMTITKPTLVLKDRVGAPFALVFEGLGRDDLDLKRVGLKKGATAVVPGACRVPPKEEGKRGFVRVEEGRAGEVRAIPGPLERVLQLSESVSWQGGDAVSGKGACETCGLEKETLMRCTGCGRVRYCNKACQEKGWKVDNHKTDCKILKAMHEIWGSSSAWISRA